MSIVDKGFGLTTRNHSHIYIYIYTHNFLFFFFTDRPNKICTWYKYRREINLKEFYYITVK